MALQFCPFCGNKLVLGVGLVKCASCRLWYPMWDEWVPTPIAARYCPFCGVACDMPIIDLGTYHCQGGTDE